MTHSENFTHESPRTIRNTFSNKLLAINNALPFAKQERETIYVWKNSLHADKSEYTLRKRSDIITLNSEHIVYTQPFNADSKHQPLGHYRNANEQVKFSES